MRSGQRCSSSRYGIALITAGITIGLVGCSTSASTSTSVASNGKCHITTAPAPLAIAVGDRSNVPALSYPPLLVSLLAAAANGGKRISLIRIDGQPKIFSPVPFTTTAKNSRARSHDVDQYVNDTIVPILAPHGEIAAKVPQANVLAALDLAASATGPGGNIVLIDSGLQTVTPLNYADPGLLMSPPSDIVKFLRQQNLLPHLHGRHVLLVGFGYTASPQPALNQAQQDSVIAQWEAVIKASGGCAVVDSAPNTSPEQRDLPVVSVVVPPKTPSFANCATLGQLATKLKQGSEHITLIGSTSTEGGNAINNPLSRERAQAVEKVLVSLGIASSRITTIGDGSHWPGRVPDIGPHGELLPGPAEEDREVIVQLPKCK
jgi:OOP family OmpA-OmpF porin